jgi:hypothetical protein
MLYEVAFSEEASSQLEDLEDYLAERFYPENAETIYPTTHPSVPGVGHRPISWNKTRRSGSRYQDDRV